ncbi:hypothetical protein WMY93_024203 [Mugilogobius chulae]|uniref:Uncharacterized protein n=1 Tax=Mugilogobius chulae TaxID=88201 RepID=A0AAW0N2E0_9GOBI
MPKVKGYKRVLAAARRRAEQLAGQPAVPIPVRLSPRRGEVGTPTPLGTGSRHAVWRHPWPTSSISGKCHRLVVPPESPDKKFVLIVGNSHLRAIVDGIVPMPEGCLSFGFSATPGGCARDVQVELAGDNLTRGECSCILHFWSLLSYLTLYRIVCLINNCNFSEPALVCLMAPCNNLTASRTVDEAAKEFLQLLTYVTGRWPKVCVVDFPPRLVGSVEIQTLLRQAYHRVAASMSVSYFPIAEHFPRSHTELWEDKGVHLSDSDGMQVLVQLLWQACYMQLEASSPTSSVAPPLCRPSTRRVSPRVVVTGPLPVPRPPPSEWTLVGQGREDQPRDSERPLVGPMGQLVPQEGENVFSIPLSPTLFSPAMLVEMDRFAPSDLGTGEGMATFPSGKKTSQVRRRKVVASKKRRPKRQVAPVVVAVRPGSPASSPSAPEDVQEEAVVVAVTPGTSPTSVVVLDAFGEDERGDVGVTPGTSLARFGNQTAMVTAQESSPPVTSWPSPSNSSPPSATTQPSLLSVPPAHQEESASGQGDKDKCCCAQFDVENGDSVRSVVRGSFNQGDRRRFRYAGTQCMVIALAALAEHKVSCVCSWDQWQLDRVLYVGDAVYTELRDLELTRGRESLLLTDLPNESVVGGQQFSFAYSEPLAGAVNVVEHEFIRDEVWVTFDSALEQLLAQYDTCLLTLCGNTVAVIKHNGRFAVVDSHARSASGMVHHNGTSVVLYFRSVNELYSYFCELAGCYGMDLKLFEMCGVNVVVADGVRGLECEEPAEVSSSVPQNTTLTGLKRKQSTSRRQRGLKRKKAAGVAPSVPPNASPRGLKHEECTEVSSSVPPMQDSDVDLDVVVTGVQDSPLLFNPISESACKDLCKQLKADFEKLGVADPQPVGPLGKNQA